MPLQNELIQTFIRSTPKLVELLTTYHQSPTNEEAISTAETEFVAAFEVFYGYAVKEAKCKCCPPTHIHLWNFDKEGFRSVIIDYVKPQRIFIACASRARGTSGISEQETFTWDELQTFLAESTENQRA